MTWPPECSARLRELLRERCGGEQGVMARAAGVTQQAVSNWVSEVSPSEPKAGAMRELLASLGVSANWLFFGVGPREGVGSASVDYTAGFEAGRAEERNAIERALEADYALRRLRPPSGLGQSPAPPAPQGSDDEQAPPLRRAAKRRR